MEKLVPTVGLEPTLFWNSILSRARLPFRHVGICSAGIKHQPAERVKNLLWNECGAVSEKRRESAVDSLRVTFQNNQNE